MDCLILTVSLVVLIAQVFNWFIKFGECIFLLICRLEPEGFNPLGSSYPWGSCGNTSEFKVFTNIVGKHALSFDCRIQHVDFELWLLNLQHWFSCFDFSTKVFYFTLLCIVDGYLNFVGCIFSVQKNCFGGHAYSLGYGRWEPFLVANFPGCVIGLSPFQTMDIYSRWSSLIHLIISILTL
jgi:hypothetical protein